MQEILMDATVRAWLQDAYARGWADRGKRDAEIADRHNNGLDGKATQRRIDGIAAAIRAVPDPVGLVAREGDGVEGV